MLIEFLTSDFMLRAALAGLGTAAAAGVLGCFVIWRRMAYFGDATAHAAILGVALGLAFGAGPLPGVLVVAAAMGWAVSALSGRGASPDAALGVLSHGALAAGLVAVALVPQARVDLMAYLFGDILSVGWIDLAAIWAGALAILALMVWRWRRLLTATLSPDIAFAAGFDPRREELVLTLTLALVVALALKAIGALLITAMLIIPAAAARPLSRTPEAMAALAVAIGALAVMGGLGGAYRWDLPAGPAIVVAAVAFFVLSRSFAKLRLRLNGGRA